MTDAKKGQCRMAYSVGRDALTVLFALRRVIFALQVILLRSGIAFGSLWANKIPLNNTFDLSKISLYTKYRISLDNQSHPPESLISNICVTGYETNRIR